ncbi:MAG: dipeptidase [Pseudomonadota bacterium]
MRMFFSAAALLCLSACAVQGELPPLSADPAITPDVAAEAMIEATDPASAAPEAMESDPPMSEARALHERLIVMDSHLDTPILLERPGFDITERHDPILDYSQVDLPRMIEGGLDGGYWVIYTPQGPLTEAGYASARDSALLRAVAIQRMLAAYPEHFAIATRSEDAAKIHAQGKRIVYQSIENSYPLGEDISLLETFYDLGVRMVGPVHFRNNQFADSGTDVAGPMWDGLSPIGEELVKEANRLGMIIDASHAHDLAFDDMVELSATPIVLSHSGTRALYDHPRNLDDARLQKLAESGGVIQMNALGAYLKALQQEPARQTALAEVFAAFRELGSDATEAEYEAILERRRQIDAEFPADMADFEDFMEQTLYALELLGTDHVGIGADWDGGGGVIGMRDIAAFPLITERLLAEGYTEEDLTKIWGGNLTRLLKAAEDHADALKAAAAAEAASQVAE